MKLTANQPAPEFSLPNEEMELVELAQFRGENHVILFFYPRDNTPCCIQEITDFSDHEEEFSEHGAVLLGISGDDCLIHAEFCDREGIGIHLLSDKEGTVCKKYGVLRQTECNDTKKFSISRSTFIIHKDGKIHHALYDVDPHDMEHHNHMLSTLHLVKEMNEQDS